MSKQINKYTVDKLSDKIKALKTELKQYEDELERRKQVISFGVPFIPRNEEKYWFITDRGYVSHLINEDTLIDRDTIEFLNSFCSKESAERHLEMLLDWRKDGLLANAKGEPINIKVLLPLLKNGYVAMDKDGVWFWYSEKPILENSCWGMRKGFCSRICGFNLKLAEDWETSLMKCGL